MRTVRSLPLLLVLPGLLLLAGCLARPQVVELTDPVIEIDTVWRGEVRIRGVATVKKTARLTIEPGTRIVFAPVDRDGDGIGDSELLIEGELDARGTAPAPIVFTSGAERPQKADWKYLYLDFASPSVLQHVISEYAYSGIQVHFCRARILDSIFRHNVDGVRFSTVNIEVAGNRIHDNTHGVRYEERRSTAHIHHNDIRDNDIGLFAVTRSEDRSLIEYNNIVGSRSYQVKLGLRQRADITLPRNWWGTTDAEKRQKTFFDHRYDRNLGRVSAPEPLSGPVSIERWKDMRGETI